MLVKGIVPRGYCKGVVRAIEIAKKQAHQTAPVYILGMIVHNQYIVNALEDLGIQTIDIKGKTRLELLDEINEGKVIITAHGASQKVFDKAKEKGLEVIDAGANMVTVEIKDGGKSFMRITDNGSGIERDDIELAFTPHATSKIKGATDLLGVSTLGFRGEALASVAAVSQLEMITKVKREDVGYRYRIDGGESK